MVSNELPYRIDGGRNREYTRLIKLIWQQLHQLDPKETISMEKAPSPHGIASFLTVSKARRLISLLIRFFPLDQSFLLLQSVFYSFKEIQVQAVDPVAVLKELDEYAVQVVYPFVSIFSQANMSFLIRCLNILEKSDFISIARTKVFHGKEISHMEVARSSFAHPVCESRRNH